MTTDTFLGRNGCASDEVVAEYLLRDGKLIARCWGSEHEADPAATVAELEEQAAVSREMTDVCGPGSDHPAREQAATLAALAIRVAFGLHALPGRCEHEWHNYGVIIDANGNSREDWACQLCGAER